eukprot:9500777-Pyramimonas_sp.AAC.1
MVHTRGDFACSANVQSTISIQLKCGLFTDCSSGEPATRRSTSSCWIEAPPSPVPNAQCQGRPSSRLEINSTCFTACSAN